MNEFFWMYQQNVHGKECGWNVKASRKDSYMQILTRTIFDFSMDNIKFVELLSETEGTQNLSGQVVKLLSETEGTQNLSGNFVCLKF